VFAERAVRSLEATYAPDDLMLLRPLHMLACIHMKRKKTSKAREAFRKMQSIRTELPADRALIHSTSAALLRAEGRYREAEQEYLAAFAVWEECGEGKSVDAAAELDGLGSVYVLEGRYQEAGPVLDRAIAMLIPAKDALPMDRIKLLHARALLHTREGEWRSAEEKLRSAISIADADTRLDPNEVEVMLKNYARVLRKNHQGSEARSIEARAAATVHVARAKRDIVDISELLVKAKAGKR
jgi:tetratricopeptide (TPR) repeat protein